MCVCLFVRAYIHVYTCSYKGTSDCVMVSKLDMQIFTSEFESHWVPHSLGLAPHLGQKPSKLRDTHSYTHVFVVVVVSFSLFCFTLSLSFSLFLFLSIYILSNGYIPIFTYILSIEWVEHNVSECIRNLVFRAFPYL